MTVSEAIEKSRGGKALFLNRLSVKYADKLLLENENVLTAVIANIKTPRDSYPGVVVLTDQRVFTACGLPGIKRSVIIPLDELDDCGESGTVIMYTATFRSKDKTFSMLAQKRGARVILSEPMEERRNKALQLGASIAIDPMSCDVVEKVREITGGLGAKVVFDTTAVPALAAQAIDCAAVCGTIVMARRMTLEGAKVKVVAELLPYSGGLKRNIVQCLDDFGIPLKLSHTIIDIEGKSIYRPVRSRKSGRTAVLFRERKRDIPVTRFCFPAA